MASGGSAPTPPNPATVARIAKDQSIDLTDWANNQNRVNYSNNIGSANWTKTPVFNETGYNDAYAKWQAQSTDPVAAYLQANPDVAQDLTYGSNPYQHYMLYGKDEGRIWGGEAGTPSKDDFTTYEWSGTSSLNPQEQGIYQAGADFRTGIANTLAGNSAGIFAKAGPTDYSGVHGLQTVGDVYDPQMNSLLNESQRGIAARVSPKARGVAGTLDPTARKTADYLTRDDLWDQQMVGDFSGTAPTYDKMSGNYNIGTFDGGPQIRDWGTLFAGMGDDLTGMGGDFDAAAGDFADMGTSYGNRRSSMRDWAGILAPQLQGLNSELSGMDPWAYDQEGADAMYRQSMRYTEPKWQDDRKMIEARLGEQGFVPGTPAYDNALKQMLDSQATERDQARDKSLLAGREYGNQAYDNRSGTLQSAIENLLGFGDLGVAVDTQRDTGDLGFGKLGADFGKLRLDALLGGAGVREIGGKQALDAGRLGLDSDIARGDQSRDTFTTNQNAVIDQFGLDKNKLDFNNTWANQGFNDSLDIANFNADAAGANNADASMRANDLISGAKYNLEAAGADNKSLIDFLTTNNDAIGQNNKSLIDFLTANNNAIGQDNKSLVDFFSANQGAVGDNNDALSQAYRDEILGVEENNRARTQGLGEADLTQQGDLNWLTSLFDQLGIQVPPDMMQAGGGNPTGADIESLFNNLFSGQMAGYNADVSSGNANTAAAGAIASAIAAALISDRRLKTDISPAGKSPKGYPWYKFRYIWDKPGIFREGVMAQDVLAAGGEGVVTHPLGFYMVDYSKV